MRFNHRSPYHWLLVAVVAVIALFTFSHAHGQGTGEASQKQLNLRKPSGLDSMPAPPAEPSSVPPGTPPRDVTLVPKKDEIKQPASTTRTVKRAARRTIERSRTGVGGIDASGPAAN